MSPLLAPALLVTGILALLMARRTDARSAPSAPAPVIAALKPDASPRSWPIPAAGAPYVELIDAAEAAHGIPTGLLARVLWQESRFRPDIINGTTRSSAGAVGIAQFMPATAEELGIDPLDPVQAIDGAGKYLARLHRMFGNWREALAAYNWGMGNVTRRGISNAPTETRTYVAQVMGDIFGSEEA